MPKIIVNICTYKRPKMLQECVHSLITQKIPDAWELDIHIIDNDPDGIMPDWIDLRSDTTVIRYAKEVQRGIPFARNLAVQKSLEHDADWIGFIDDDEIASDDWLNAFIDAIQKHKADAFTGPVTYIFPKDHADWLANRNEDDTPDGSKKNRASTNNVIISKHVFTDVNRPMRFDERMAFMGGSDSDFFMRLVANGGSIVFVKHAVVVEKVLDSRTTMQWRLKRQMRSSSNRVYINIKLLGLSKSSIFVFKECSRHLLEGSIGLLISPFFLIKGWLSFKRKFYHALRHFAKLTGNLIGIFGVHPQPYKKVDGF